MRGALYPILFNKNKYALDFIPKSSNAAAYSTRRLRSSYTGYPLRIKDNTGTEFDVPFCGENLCTGTMLNWLGRNQVASYQLGTDANSNGVSDGWSTTNNGITTVSRTIDESAQKVTITSANINNASATTYKNVAITTGNTITFSVKYKTDNLYARFAITQQPANTNVNTVSNKTSVGEYTTETIVATITTAGQTSVDITCSVRAINVGDTGSAWFKDASVTISNQSAYVTTWYDQSGNNNHAVQTTAANQPRIVNAGVLDVNANGTPTIQTILASDTHFVVTNNATLQLTTKSTFSIVHNPTNIGETNAGRILDKNATTDYFIGLSVTTKINTIGSRQSLDGAFVFTKININTIVHDDIADTTKIYYNGALNNTTDAATYPTSATSLYLLNRSAGDRQYNGKISELILFGTTLTDTQRSKIEKSQSKYYGVAV